MSIITRTLLLAILVACSHGEVQAQAERARVLTDQVYDARGKALDLCIPTTRDRVTSTLVVFIHGGGFVEGDKADMLSFCRLYAAAGFVSATPNYRLSGEAPYPAALEDVEAALVWLGQNIRPYDAPVGKIVLVGYSAGGTLALLAKHPKVSARVSAAGPTDLGALQRATPFPKLRSDLTAFLGETDPKLASPLYQAQIAAQPMFLFHGKTDALVPVQQSLSLAQEVQRRGGKVLLRVFEGVGHEVMLPQNPQLAQLLEELSAFILTVDASP